MPTVLRDAAGGHKMALDKDVEIRLSDGAVLRADLYRPAPEGKYPALMTYGPYGKDSHISQFMGEGWTKLKALIRALSFRISSHVRQCRAKRKQSI